MFSFCENKYSDKCLTILHHKWTWMNFQSFGSYKKPIQRIALGWSLTHPARDSVEWSSLQPKSCRHLKTQDPQLECTPKVYIHPAKERDTAGYCFVWYKTFSFFSDMLFPQRVRKCTTTRTPEAIKQFCGGKHPENTQPQETRPISILVVPGTKREHAFGIDSNKRKRNRNNCRMSNFKLNAKWEYSGGNVKFEFRSIGDVPPGCWLLEANNKETENNKSHHHYLVRCTCSSS